MPDWMDRARCQGMPLDLFFECTRSQHNALRMLCQGCPVLTQCRTFTDEAEAFSTSSELVHGFVGGETRWQRIDRRIAARRQARAS